MEYLNFKMLIQIDSGYFCAGVVLINNKVTLSAPILSYMKGWNIFRIDNYCNKKQWKWIHVIPAIKPLINMQHEIRLALLPSLQEEIQISTYTKSTKGVEATPDKLFKIVKAALEVGICQFIYKKKDGTLRKATGTRKYDIMPKTDPDPNFRPQDYADSDIKTAYWDYDSSSFKSFQNTSIVAVLVF